MKSQRAKKKIDKTLRGFDERILLIVKYYFEDGEPSRIVHARDIAQDLLRFRDQVRSKMGVNELTDDLMELTQSTVDSSLTLRDVYRIDHPSLLTVVCASLLGRQSGQTIRSETVRYCLDSLNGLSVAYAVPRPELAITALQRSFRNIL